MSGGAWRFRCPEGHSGYSYRPEAGQIACRACERTYSRRLDMKTGEVVPI